MTTNIEIDTDGSNTFTVDTTKIEELINKKVTVITPGTGSGNRAAGPKDNLIVDLLMITTRFNVDGYIDQADKSKFKTVLKAGGTFKMTYAGESFVCNFEKVSIIEGGEFQVDSDSPSDKPSTYTVKFSLIVGVDI